MWEPSRLWQQGLAEETQTEGEVSGAGDIASPLLLETTVDEHHAISKPGKEQNKRSAPGNGSPG
jgi:hypothetical protein